MMMLGRIVQVDAKARRARVKTLGVDPLTNDLDLYNVRWLHEAWNYDGDDSTYVPRVGTYVIVAFVNRDAFILGCIPLDVSNGNFQEANSNELNPGDKIIATIGGNRFVLRTGGAIEVVSTPACRTFYLPSENLINTICQNYELLISGGYVKWTLDKKEETTSADVKIWDALSPTAAVRLQAGHIPDPLTEDTTERAITPPPEADSIFSLSAGPLNTENLDFEKLSCLLRIKKDGTAYLDIGPGKASLLITSETGDIELATKGLVKALIEKTLELTIKEGATLTVEKNDLNIDLRDGGAKLNATKDISVKTDGATSLSSKAAFSINSEADVALSSKSSTKLSADGAAEVTAKSEAKLQGDAGTTVGAAQSVTRVEGSTVSLAGGGAPVARFGDQAVGIGNEGRPVVSNIIQGSPRVTTG